MILKDNCHVLQDFVNLSILFFVILEELPLSLYFETGRFSLKCNSSSGSCTSHYWNLGLSNVFKLGSLWNINVCFVAGTLRPDLIESASALASSNAEAIKTHHNDTELVRQLRAKGRVVEPLKDFHKDEVRALGKDLGLPMDVVHRHPFPGR